MKISRILPVAGILAMLACGAAFAQSNQIPVGAGAGADRQPPGSGWRDPTNPTPGAAQSSTTKSAIKRKPAATSSAKNTKATAQ
jgi:hypothetical protein